MLDLILDLVPDLVPNLLFNLVSDFGPKSSSRSATKCCVRSVAKPGIRSMVLVDLSLVSKGRNE